MDLEPPLSPGDVLDARLTLMGDIAEHVPRSSEKDQAALADYLLRGDFISQAYFEMLRDTR